MKITVNLTAQDLIDLAVDKAEKNGVINAKGLAERGGGASVVITAPRETSEVSIRGSNEVANVVIEIG